MSANKRKGSAFEREVVEYLRSEGFDVSRRYAVGLRDDKGDIDGLEEWTIECKNHNGLDLAGWSDETERERICADTPFGLLVVKRRTKSIAKAYCIQPLEQAARLIRITEHYLRTSAT